MTVLNEQEHVQGQIEKHSHSVHHVLTGKSDEKSHRERFWQEHFLELLGFLRVFL